MADQTSSLIVRLIDQVTAPAKKIAGSLKGITGAAKGGAAVTGMDRLNAAMARSNNRLSIVRGQMVDAIATIYTLSRALNAPIASARAFEAALTEIGNKSGMSTERLTEFGKQAIALSKVTNQSTADLLKGADILIGYGMEAGTAAKSLDAIGKTATATGASIEDLSKLGTASILNLKVPVEQLQLAFDKLAYAGKAGGFELKDMAQYFPDLGAAFATFGQEGVGAVTDLGAALQIVKRSTGDTSQAANALANLLQKARAPLTVKKFEDYGIDIRQEIDKGIAAGMSPIDIIVEQTRKAQSKGAILEDLFSDKQVLEAMRPLLQFFDDYKKLREDANQAAGVVMADFEKKMQTNAERTKAFQITLDNLSLSIGNALLPALTSITAKITPIVEAITRWAEKHPKLTAAIVGSLAGFFALNAALVVLKYVTAAGWGGLLTITSGLLSLGGAVGLGSLSLGALLGVAAGISAIGLAVGAWAYVNWDELTAGWYGFTSKLGISDDDMKRLGDTTKRLKEATGIDLSFLKMDEGTGYEKGSALGAFVNKEIAGMMRGFDDLVKEVEWTKGIIESAFSGALFRNWAMSIGTAVAEVKYKVKSSIEGFGETMNAKAVEWEQAGRNMVQALWDGMKALFNDLINWVGKKASELLAPFTGLGARIKGALGFGGGEAAPSGPIMAPTHGSNSNVVPLVKGQAKGGPVNRGQAYLVGERGPEIFRPSSSGEIIPNKSLAGGGGGVTVNQTFSFNVAGNADASTVEEIRRVMRDEVQRAFRGVYADAGLRFA